MTRLEFRIRETQEASNLGYPPNSGERRLLVVSHPAVLAVNQLVFADLAGHRWHVDLVAPRRWHHDYSEADIDVAPVPALAGSFHKLPVLLPGRPQRHVYLANPLRVIRMTRPDVIFVEQEPSSLAALQWAIAARVLGVPFGVQMDENIDRALPSPVRRARSWVLRHAAFVAARSPRAAHLVKHLGACGEIALIPHHVPGWVAQEQEESGRFRIGFAGRFVPEKGLDVLVNAVRLLEDPFDLVVAGQGPMRAWLESTDLGAGTLRLVSGLSHDEMPLAYAQMDVLVLPSRTTATWVEQFGRVLVEALWCGVPVVGSDTGGIRWVIETTEGGMLFPDGDYVALSECLKTLRDNDNVRCQYAQRGSQLSRKLFSVGAVASELGPLLERASIQSRGSPGYRHLRSSPVGRVDARPRVALVAHGIHDRGGMERACAELIRHTHTEVRYIAVTAELEPDLQPLVEWSRIRVPRRPIPLKFIVFFCVAGWAVRRADPDIVHTVGAIIPNRADVATVQYCHAGARQALGALAPREAPVARRINTTVHRRLALFAESWCYRPGRLRHFAAVSSGVATELACHYAGIPVASVPNGVDVERFHPNVECRVAFREDQGVGSGDLVALFVGGDWDRKGLAVAFEALGLVRGKGAPLWLWVVGSGDEQRFTRLGVVTGVMPWVRFFGHQHDTERFYQAADMFLLPTQYETFSLVSYEAAACGLPIVATAVSGIAELIGADEAGILVNRDRLTVAQALEFLVRDPNTRRRLGDEAQRRATTYSWSASARAGLDLYRVLSPPPVRGDGP